MIIRKVRMTRRRIEDYHLGGSLTNSQLPDPGRQQDTNRWKCDIVAFI